MLNKILGCEFLIDVPINTKIIVVNDNAHNISLAYFVHFGWLLCVVNPQEMPIVGKPVLAVDVVDISAVTVNTAVLLL